MTNGKMKKTMRRWKALDHYSIVRIALVVMVLSRVGLSVMKTMTVFLTWLTLILQNILMMKDGKHIICAF